MTKQEKAALRTAAARLRALTNPDDASECCISPEVKRAVSIYVQTWILPVVDAAATDPGKRDHDQKTILDQAARDLYPLT